MLFLAINLHIRIMLLLTLFLAVLVAAEAPLSRPNLCGNTEIPDDFAKIVSGLSTVESSIKLQSRSIGRRGALPLIDIPVHFHTVSSEAKKDSIPAAALEAQYAVLRDVYVQYDINMQWDGTVASRTVDDWLATGNWQLAALKRGSHEEERVVDESEKGRIYRFELLFL